jgi:hypothetical protein
MVELKVSWCGIRYDPYHNSALNAFLMRRALKSPSYIGHLFFWYLKACAYEGALSFATKISSCNREYPYKMITGRQNDNIPSS